MLTCFVQFVLTPSGPVPGECLPLNGTKGEISIRLREPIIPTAVTYEHVPSAITFDFRSAPNDITVVSTSGCRCCPGAALLLMPVAFLGCDWQPPSSGRCTPADSFDSKSEAFLRAAWMHAPGLTGTPLHRWAGSLRHTGLPKRRAAGSLSWSTASPSPPPRSAGSPLTSPRATCRPWLWTVTLLWTMSASRCVS